MSKVYQALKKAHEERRRSDAPPESVSHETQAVHSTTTVLQTESEMQELADNIARLLPNLDKYVIQFIASSEGEGTSILIREFASNLADKGKKSVLLVETNLECLDQHRVFGLEPKLGLDLILKEGISLDKGISQVGKSNLFLATLLAKSVMNPSTRSVFGAERLWEQLRERFDFILIDSPCLSVNTETLALCEKVDGVLLVVEPDTNESRNTHNVRDRIFQSGGNLLGLVFNKRRMYILWPPNSSEE